MSDNNSIKPWTAKRKAAVVMFFFKGKTTVAEKARQHDLTVSEVDSGRSSGIRLKWGNCCSLRVNIDWLLQVDAQYRCAYGGLKSEQDVMAVEFRDAWLEAFYEEDQSHKKIPNTIEGALFRKLQILGAASEESDLRIPRGIDLNNFRAIYLDGVRSG